MFIPDPGFIPFRITDPKITKMRKGKKSSCLSFIVAINFTKFKMMFLPGTENNQIFELINIELTYFFIQN
jgi:hypothetical protein